MKNAPARLSAGDMYELGSESVIPSRSVDPAAGASKEEKMDSYTIVSCRICGKLMKRYAFAVYPGDSSCCDECNRKVDSPDYSSGLEDLKDQTSKDKP